MFWKYFLPKLDFGYIFCHLGWQDLPLFAPLAISPSYKGCGNACCLAEQPNRRIRWSNFVMSKQSSSTPWQHSSHGTEDLGCKYWYGPLNQGSWSFLCQGSSESTWWQRRIVAPFNNGISLTVCSALCCQVKLKTAKLVGKGHMVISWVSWPSPGNKQ